MKISKTISIEMSIWTNFFNLVEQNGRDHNAVISKLMNDYVKDNIAAEHQIIICEKCGAKYSDAIPKCPNCEASEIEQKTKERLAIESKDRELTKHEQRIIELEIELESYRNTLDRLNDPQGHTLNEITLNEQKERIEKETARLEGELELEKATEGVPHE